jgi:hypothetical protein
VQQAVLRSFAATGNPPPTELLEETATAFGATASEVLAVLAREDFLALDTAGRIWAAYPFSAVSTRHRVRIVGGAVVYAMYRHGPQVGRERITQSLGPCSARRRPSSSAGTLSAPCWPADAHTGWPAEPHRACPVCPQRINTPAPQGNEDLRAGVAGLRTSRFAGAGI